MPHAAIDGTTIGASPAPSWPLLNNPYTRMWFIESRWVVYAAGGADEVSYSGRPHNCLESWRAAAKTPQPLLAGSMQCAVWVETSGRWRMTRQVREIWCFEQKQGDLAAGSRGQRGDAYKLPSSVRCRNASESEYIDLNLSAAE